MMTHIIRTPDMDMHDLQLAAMTEARRIALLDAPQREPALRRLISEVHSLKRPDEQLGNLYGRMHAAAKVMS